MSILTGASCASVKAAAVAYSIDGFSVIPLWGKKPANGVLWQAFQHGRAGVMDIHRWDKYRQLQNVGIVCGAVSGNLVVMDCDGLDGSEFFEMTFPELTDTFTVATGSGKGYHYYYFVEQLPPTVRALNVGGQNLELRAGGCYVVAPPSIHPDTAKHYSVATRLPILHLKHLFEVADWLGSLIRGRAWQTKPTSQPPARPAERRTMLGRGRIRYPAAYCRAALERETQALLATPEGGRNVQLNTSAYNIGQLVGDGLLSRDKAESELLSTARRAGLGESESLRTIRSGLDKGIEATRSAQWSRRAP